MPRESKKKLERAEYVLHELRALYPEAKTELSHRSPL